MSLKSFFKSFLNQDYQESKKKFYPHKKRKKARISKCNVLRFWMGTFSSDSGLHDYTRYYKVMNGKVKKRVLRKHRPNEVTNIFDYIELRPLTDSAYVKVIERSLRPSPAFVIPRASISRYKSIYKIVLYKNKGNRRPTLINIDNK